MPTSEGLRARKERHRRRNRIYRAAVAITGFLLVVLGIVLVPLPGPGWLVVAIGLGLLALEFDRAERMLVPLLDRLERIAEQASDAHPLAKVGMIALTVLGIGGSIAAVILFELPYLPG